MRNQKGFSIALDALMAIILVTAIIVFLSQQPAIPFSGIDSSQRLQQSLGHAFSSLEESGILTDILVERKFHDTNSALEVFLQAKKLLPENSELRVRIWAYDANGATANCQIVRDFNSCFTAQNPAQSNYPSANPPPNKSIVYGKRIFSINQPGSELTGVGGEVYCAPEDETFAQSPTPLEIKKPVSHSARFDTNQLPLLEFKTQVYQNEMRCADSTPANPPPNNPGSGYYADYSRVTISARNQTRDAVDVFLIMDRSASMSTFDMEIQKNSNVTVSNGTCNTGNPDQNVTCESLPDLTTNCGYSSATSTQVCALNSSQYYKNWTTIGSFNWTGSTMAPAHTNWSLVFFQTPVGVPANISQVNNTCGNCGDDNYSPFVRAQRNDGLAGNSTLNSDFSGGYSIFTQNQMCPAGNCNQVYSFDVNSWNDTPLNQWIVCDTNGAGCRTPTALDTYALVYIEDKNITGNQFLPKTDETGCNYSPSTYQTVGTVTVPNDPVLGDTSNLIWVTLQSVFSGEYSGSCNAKAKIRFRPAGGGPDVNSNVSNCPGGNYCLINAPGSGNYRFSPNNRPTTAQDYTTILPAGSYDLMMATDEDINNLKAIIHSGYKFLGVAGTNAGNTSTCNGQPCVYQIDSNANCPIPAFTNAAYCFYSSNDPNCRATNWQIVSTYSIGNDTNAQHLLGLRAKSSIQDYDHSCTYSGTALTVPQYSFPYTRRHIYDNESPLTTETFGINDPVAQTFVDNFLPLDTGAYRFWAWAPDYLDGEQVDVNWYVQRVDAAKNAAKGFVDNDNWKTEDRMGIISFSNSPSLDSTLQYLDQNNKTLLKNTLNTASPNGETGIAAAIQLARTSFTDTGQTRAPFIVLLTDGLANVPAPPAVAQAQAILEAQTAYNAGIIVFTIGFGIEAIDWNVQTQKFQCKQNLTDIALYGGGKCYPANDPQQLSEIYDLIALQIQQQLGITNIEMPLYPGTLLNNPSCVPNTDCAGGVWLRTYDSNFGTFSDVNWNSLYSPNQWHAVVNNQSLVFKNAFLNQTVDWWDANFNVSVPCSANQCIQTITFPSDGTTIETPDFNLAWPPDDGNGIHERETIVVRTRNLSIDFTRGYFLGNRLYLDFNLTNVEDLNISFSNPAHKESGCVSLRLQTKVFANVPEPPDFFGSGALYTNPCMIPDAPPVIPGTFPAKGDRTYEVGETEGFNINFVNSAGGYIYIVMNPNQTGGTNVPLNECKQDNWDKLYCFKQSTPKIYLIEYWGWVK